ncbi:hypothetical protein ZOSMA_53G00370 [Zostera marina]|uniref:Uncharacterized protein n=1 Tax=Zostera marina TaxID=29655 RepID=A0A0K9NX53_ZOSMR|nr:hypothetical protein ZOSMA_53G00370 [Zostera marina]
MAIIFPTPQPYFTYTISHLCSFPQPPAFHLHQTPYTTVPRLCFPAVGPKGHVHRKVRIILGFHQRATGPSYRSLLASSSTMGA